MTFFLCEKIHLTNKKSTLQPQSAFRKSTECNMQLDCTSNLAGAEAPSTYVDMARSTVHESLNTTDVGLPSSVGTSVRVRNLDTKGNALAANIALCHFPAPPYL